MLFFIIFFIYIFFLLLFLLLFFININNNNGGGKFKYNKTKKYKGISKKYLENVLQVYFKNQQMAKDLCNFIYTNREFKDHVYLSKTKK